MEQTQAGRVTVIIGATGGIGSETARLLAQAGGRLTLVARQGDRLSQLASELGGETLSIVGDTTVQADMVQAVQQTLERFGRVDQLVHAVGTIKLRPLHLTSPEDFEHAWRLNTLGAFLAMKAVMPVFLKQGHGAVVCCSSVAAATGLANHEAIASAKAGIEGLVRAAAMTYAASGIRINAVAPALVKTPLSAALTTSETALKASLALHPLGRIGDAVEIAQAIRFLLESAWMTGTVMAIDGGMSAGRHPNKSS